MAGAPEGDGTPGPRSLALGVSAALVADALVVMAPPPASAPLLILWRSAHDGALALAPVLLCGAAAWCAWRFARAGAPRWALGLTLAALGAAGLARALAGTAFALH